MRGRTARYGYRIENGKPVIAEDERAVLEQICTWYRNGISLGNIAEKLNAAGVSYQPGETGWNKARLMRMLEDERYTGADGYPPIWSRETRGRSLNTRRKNEPDNFCQDSHRDDRKEQKTPAGGGAEHPAVKMRNFGFVVAFKGGLLYNFKGIDK